MLAAEQLEPSASKTLLLAGSEVPRLLFILELDLLLLGDNCCRCRPPARLISVLGGPLVFSSVWKSTESPPLAVLSLG